MEKDQGIAVSRTALPTGPLRDLLAWWRKTKTKGLIIGGLAVALRSEPRTTRDVDAVVFLDPSLWAIFLKKGREYSFRSRVSEPLDFAEKSRMLLLHHTPSKIDVDISLANSKFESEALKRASLVKVGRLAVPVATPEDLIVYKAVAHRHIDMADIEKLLDLCDNLDCAYVRRHVDELALVLEMPELFTDLDQRLREYEKKQRRRKK
jgi:hypothetical protein